MSETIPAHLRPPEQHIGELLRLGDTGWSFAGAIGPEQARMEFHLVDGLDDLTEADVSKLAIHDDEGAVREGFVLDYDEETGRSFILYRGEPNETFLAFLKSASALNAAKSHLRVTHEMLRDAFSDWVMGTYPDAKTIGDVVIRQFLTPPPEESCSIA